jgi:hypothetical protein
MSLSVVKIYLKKRSPCARCNIYNFVVFVVANGIAHNTKSTVDEYDSSGVITYFDRLNKGALPLVVVHANEHTH